MTAMPFTPLHISDVAFASATAADYSLSFLSFAF